MRTPKGIQAKLIQRRKLDMFRTLKTYDGAIDFISNDYLGLSTFPWAEMDGARNGSRLISGTSQYWLKFEEFLAEYFGFESAIFFNSGYVANIALFSNLIQRNDFVIYDELIHASVLDGLKMNDCSKVAFKHNDLNSLEEKLMSAKNKGAVYIAVESVYSMDGDIANASQIHELAEKYDAYVIADEAHAAGYLGDEGKGIFSVDNCFVKLLTFSKGYGRHGAVILGSKDVKDFLVNYGRSFIYTTALPDFVGKSIQTILENTTLLREKKQELLENVTLFNQLSGEESSVPIKQLKGNVSELQSIVEKAQHNNIALRLVQPPTVPRNKERIRLTLHAHNTEKEIKTLWELLN